MRLTRHLGDARLASELGVEQSLSEAVASSSHGEGGGTSAVLGLDDFVTSKLNAVGQSLDGLLVEGGEGGLSLGEEGDDGGARVATDDGHGELGGLERLAECLG